MSVQCLQCHREWQGIKPGDCVTYISSGRGYSYPATVEAVEEGSYKNHKRQLFTWRRVAIVFRDGHGSRIRLSRVDLYGGSHRGGGVLLPHKKRHPFTPE